MKCLKAGTIQAYMDGELDIKARKDVESHLEGCNECKRLFDELKSNDDFVFEKLSGYKSYYEDTPVQPIKHSSPACEAGNHSKVKKGVFYYMFKYQKYLAAACALAIVATCITVQPVRAVISNTLNIFRVDDLKGIRITPQELAQIRQNLSKGEGDFNLDNIGKIKLNGGKTRPASYDEVKNTCSFPVLLSGGNSDNLKPSFEIVDPSSISFTLDVKNVNTTLKSFKSKELLPEEIDQKTFTANFGAQVSTKYSIDGKNYTFIQTTPPKIEAPDGVDVDRLFNTVVNVPILPEELKSKLKSINDWKNTLYIPIIEPMEETEINGSTAYFCTLEKGKNKASALETESRIIWMNNGVICGIISNTDKDDLINFARSLR